ncbi:glycosyltransferase family 4 protein [Candidatus Pacearchaeota archaeon]|nr:glycosyltransferase family 4 protein [Candidatus Pacearchaeota archaeon]
MRIAILSEEVFGVQDEGMKKFTLKLFDVLSPEHDVIGIAVSHNDQLNIPNKFTHICSNRLFINSRLCTLLRQARPELIIYSSASCGNFFAMLRMKILKQYVPEAKIAVIVFQPAQYNRLEALFLPVLMPDYIFSQTPKTKDVFPLATEKVFFVPTGVDTQKFIPVDSKTKGVIRNRYGFNSQDFILLHVGHINRNRGVRLLAIAAKNIEAKVILAGSTSTSADKELLKELTDAGVIVLRHYFPEIEQLYQMADLYLFPVSNEDACTGVPLSVLEAMACNIPVVSTRFGGLPVMFKEGDGFHFYNLKMGELIDKLNVLKDLNINCKNRQLVLPYDWNRIGEMIIDIVLSSSGCTFE